MLFFGETLSNYCWSVANISNQYLSNIYRNYMYFIAILHHDYAPHIVIISLLLTCWRSEIVGTWTYEKSVPSVASLQFLPTNVSTSWHLDLHHSRVGTEMQGRAIAIGRGIRSCPSPAPHFDNTGRSKTTKHIWIRFGKRWKNVYDLKWIWWPNVKAHLSSLDLLLHPSQMEGKTNTSSAGS